MSGSRAPAGLQAAGRRVWRELHSAVATGWTLDERDLVVLTEAARQADLVAELERAIARDGVTVLGAAGQQRLHGAVTALTQARALLARLLAQVEIEPPAAKTGHMNRRQRAQLRSAGEAPRG